MRRGQLHQLLDELMQAHPAVEGVLMIVEVHEGQFPALAMKGLLASKAVRLRELIAQLKQDQPAENE